MMYSTSDEFANDIQETVPASPSFHMAKVTAVTNGVPYLTFYGEETQRVKGYKRLASYSPAVGDTVICAKHNNSYTILGKVV